MRPIEPRFYLADNSVQPTIITIEKALETATLVGDRRLIGEIVAPKNVVVVVKAIVPFARQRINMSSPATESVQMINPQNGNLWFNFEYTIAQKAGTQARTTVDPVSNLANAAADVTVTNTSGLVFISDNPLVDALGSWFNPLMSVPIMPNSTMQFLFSLLPAPALNGLPAGGTYQIGGNSTVTRRVDFAGVVVVGQTVAKDYYDAAMSDIQSLPGG